MSDGASPYWHSSEERTMRQRDRVRKKVQQKHSSEVTGGSHCASDTQGKGDHQTSDHAQSGEDNSSVVQLLSNIQPPQVSAIEPRCVMVKLSTPDWDSSQVEINPQDCHYQLLLSEKGKDAKYKPVFSGDATDITLNDLKPGSEYHVRACAVLSSEVKGALTEAVVFRTLTCEPEPPQPPKLVTRAKAVLKLKWNAACDNGSKITAYVLEWDKGQEGGAFSEAYSGAGRQFEATHLTPSTCYGFRLAATNEVGKSVWSDSVTFVTSGSVPPQPPPPRMVEQRVSGVTLTWEQPPADHQVLLHMDDETTGHGFIPVYNGSNSSCSLTELRRNTPYKFRLAAKNEEGVSKWSDVVTLHTLPDIPAAPVRPRLKGRVTPHCFTITWEPPNDDGGADITRFTVQLDAGQGYEAVYEGIGTEHQCEGLTPGHQYRARVACFSVGGQSQFSESCVVTTEPVVPGQCPSPKLQGKPKAVSLHIRWGQPGNDGGSAVMGYVVQMISPDKSGREAYRGPGTDCVVAGLRAGTAYLFQIRCFNKVGAGPWSEVLEVTSGAAVPDAPCAPLVTCGSPHTAAVTWQEPACNGAAVTEYRLEWTTSDGDQDFAQLYTGPRLSYEAKGLTPATVYIFRVQALNSSGGGQYSPSASGHTPPSCPGPPTSLHCQPLSPTTLLLTWQLPACNGSELTAYTVTVSDRRPAFSIPPATGHMLDGLMPNTAYRIQIQAVNGVGAGPHSSGVKVTTPPLPPSAPCLECVSLTASTVKVKWGEGRNPHHLTYGLEMAKEDGNFQVVYTGPALTHKVSRLSESTCYQFRIVASNQSGHGPYSDPLTLSTPRAPPPAVKAVHASQVGARGCEVQWTQCGGQHSDQLTYVLQLHRTQAAQQNFTEVYRGPGTQHTLQGLEPGTHYQLRAFAVRESGDGASGPFSPTAHFTPTTTVTAAPPGGKREKGEVKGGGGGSSPTVQEGGVGGGWREEQWALLMVVLMVVVAVLVAVVIQQVMAHLQSPPASPPSPSSSPNTDDSS